MKSGSTQIRSAKHVSQARPAVEFRHGRPSRRPRAAIEGAARLAEASSRRIEAVQAHPLAELLPARNDGQLLNGSSSASTSTPGDGLSPVWTLPWLYVVVSGHFCARRPDGDTSDAGTGSHGDLVELAAVLGDAIIRTR